MEAGDVMLDDFNMFEEAIDLAFGDADRFCQAETDFLSLKQRNRPVSSLVSEFQRLSIELNWPEASLFSLFYKALNDDVKDELCKINRPDKIQDYYTMAVRIDNRLFERRMEKRSSFTPRYQVNPNPRYNPKPAEPSDPDAMVIGSTTIQGPLSPSERQRCHENHLCLYCGSKDHIIKDCSLRSKKPKNLEACW